MNKLSIIIGDDHELILKGLSDRLGLLENVSTVDTAQAGDELLLKIEQKQYDVVFLDIHFGVNDGRDIAKKIKEIWPTTILAALTSFDTEETVQSAINVGFKAFFLKTDSLLELEKWVEQASFENVYLSSETTKIFSYKNLQLNNKTLTNISISNREKEVLNLIVAEFTTKRIAEELCLSEKTIENYRASLMLKMNVTNIAGLVKKAILLGLHT
jgi:DNA-binding NarL/FixJ family response regulator